MQLGRSYSRRLKSVKYDIYELYPSARHAYITIRPAVKTSRPLDFQRFYFGRSPKESFALLYGQAFGSRFLAKPKELQQYLNP